ncbi:MAG: hypothetical protein LBK44_04350 [Spirochaetales bacterium]|nr:hypothetical protein [Spirochaetales bacterium]
MQFLWAFRYNPLRSGSLRTSSRQLPWQFPGRGIAPRHSAALTSRTQLWNNCVLCHQVFLRPAAKKHVCITSGCRHHDYNS